MARLFVVGIICALVLTACGGSDTPQPVSEQTPVITPSSTPQTSDTQNIGVVARVNGIPITQEAFDKAFSQRQIGSGASDMDTLANQVLEGMIEQELIRQYTEKNGIIVTETDALDEVNTLKDAVGSAEQWQAFLNMNGFSEEDMLVAQYEALINQRLREQLFSVLEGNVLQVRARHIVVENEATAIDVMTRLQSGNEFDVLARDFSIDMATRENGGDLGWFTPDELIDDRLSQILFSLQDGAIAGPVPTRIGYHIVQRIQSEARPIEPERMALLMERRYVKWLEEQYSTASIERFR